MKLALRVVVSVALVWLCLRGVAAGEVWAALARLPAAAALACLACLIAHTLLSAWRWRLVCDTLALPAPEPRDALRWTALSVTFSQLLPSTVGGDAYRIGAFSAQRGWAAAARSVIHDRLNGLWVLGALAAAGAVPTLWRGGFNGATIALLVAASAGLLALPALVPLPGLSAESAAFRALLRNARLLYASLAIHAMTLAAFGALAAGLQPASPLWWQAALVAPAVLLGAALPVSLGGWGVREGGMVLALAPFGVAAGEALALSVAYGLMLALTGALGAAAWALTSRSPRTPPAPCASRSRARSR